MWAPTAGGGRPTAALGDTGGGTVTSHPGGGVGGCDRTEVRSNKKLVSKVFVNFTNKCHEAQAPTNINLVQKQDGSQRLGVMKELRSALDTAQLDGEGVSDQKAG